MGPIVGCPILGTADPDSLRGGHSRPYHESWVFDHQYIILRVSFSNEIVYHFNILKLVC